ncbi:hypothetical protein [Halalkalicoccus salilacus]
MDFDELGHILNPPVRRGSFSESPVFGSKFVEVKNGYAVANI